MVGTNGKGTVTTMISRGLTASGMRTGRFLSPHVEEFEERVAIDDAPIARGAVDEFVMQARALDASWPGREELRPAFFEWTLALALATFERERVDAAVLEAGVGGRDDATRAVEPVSLTVLTNVDLDHMDVLGSSLLQIAEEKAHAFRPGVPAVCGARHPEALSAVQAVAAEIGTPLHIDPAAAAAAGVEIGPDPLFELPRGAASWAYGAAARAASPNRLANARLAAAALRLLGCGEDAVEEGLRARALPARFERFTLPPADGAPALPVVLDGAHDPAAAEALARGLPSGYVLLFGALSRKQGERVLGVLAPGAAAVIITDAAEGDAARVSWPGALYLSAAADALDAALAAARRGHEEPLTVVVAGSLYLAGRIRPLLRELGHREADPWEAAAP